MARSNTLADTTGWVRLCAGTAIAAALVTLAATLIAFVCFGRITAWSLFVATPLLVFAMLFFYLAVKNRLPALAWKHRSQAGDAISTAHDLRLHESPSADTRARR